MMRKEQENQQRKLKLEMVKMIIEKSVDFNIDLNLKELNFPGRNIVFHFAFENG